MYTVLAFRSKLKMEDFKEVNKALKVSSWFKGQRWGVIGVSKHTRFGFLFAFMTMELSYLFQVINNRLDYYV